MNEEAETADGSLPRILVTPRRTVAQNESSFPLITWDRTYALLLRNLAAVRACGDGLPRWFASIRGWLGSRPGQCCRFLSDVTIRAHPEQFFWSFYNCQRSFRDSVYLRMRLDVRDEANERLARSSRQPMAANWTRRVRISWNDMLLFFACTSSSW